MHVSHIGRQPSSAFTLRLDGDPSCCSSPLGPLLHIQLQASKCPYPLFHLQLQGPLPDGVPDASPLPHHWGRLAKQAQERGRRFEPCRLHHRVRGGHALQLRCLRPLVEHHLEEAKPRQLRRARVHVARKGLRRRKERHNRSAVHGHQQAGQLPDDWKQAKQTCAEHNDHGRIHLTVGCHLDAHVAKAFRKLGQQVLLARPAALGIELMHVHTRWPRGSVVELSWHHRHT
mmetsp:Transcript_21090/g.53987  ORF Transcript_21090/g.53987 Transcript_21090/m.53987 type:complete len:230 (-) Transcript_21090:404-1093(-)